MDRAYSMHGREDEYIQGFGGKTRKKETATNTETYMGG
jgi:hypothetical protein